MCRQTKRAAGEAMLYGAFLLALGAFAVAAQALCGYWTGSNWQRWGPEGSVAMAPNTATAIAILAMAVMIALAGLRVRFGIGYNQLT